MLHISRSLRRAAVARHRSAAPLALRALASSTTAGSGTSSAGRGLDGPPFRFSPTPHTPPKPKAKAKAAPIKEARLADEEQQMTVGFDGKEFATYHVGGTGRMLRVAQDVSSSMAFEQGDFTGTVVWNAAPVLSDWLSKDGGAAVTGRRVVEIGAGTGLVGLTAAALGAKRVVLTDRRVPESAVFVTVDGSMEQMPSGHSTKILDLLQENINANRAALGAADVKVEELTWGEKQSVKRIKKAHGPVDIVVGADVFYTPDEGEARKLVRTIKRLLDDGWEFGEAVIAWKQRRDDQLDVLDRVCRKEGMRVTVADRVEKDGDTIWIHRLRPGDVNSRFIYGYGYSAYPAGGGSGAQTGGAGGAGGGASSAGSGGMQAKSKREVIKSYHPGGHAGTLFHGW